MSFTTPWLPVFNNTQLALYPAYADLIEDAAVPVFKEDPEWSRRSFKALFDAAPQVEEALWEVVLAIWRLRLVQTEGIKEESWRKLVSAWLHRHRELCQSARIEPLKVIVGFENSLLTLREFPGDLLPGLNRPLATTIPDPAITTRVPALRGLTSGANEQQKRKIQPTKALVKPLAAVDKDIDMVVGDSRDTEPPGRSQRKAAQKRKAVTDVRGKTGGEDTSGVDDTDSADELNLTSNRKGLPPKSRTTLAGEGKAVAKDTGEVELVSTKASGGRKHFMQVSHIEIQSKRAKVTGVVDERSDEDEESEEDGGEEVEEQVAPEPRHLQGLSFEKGSAVDLEIMVPALIGRLCKYCKMGKRMRPCTPLWETHRGNPAISCFACVQGRQRCSFTDADLSIASWPKVVPKANKSSTPRREDASKKQHSAGKVSGKKKSRAETRRMGSPTPTIPARATRSCSERSVISVSSEADHDFLDSDGRRTLRQPISEAHPPYLSSSMGVIGHEERVFLPEIHGFSTLIGERSGSVEGLMELRTTIRAAVARESASSSTVAQMVQERSEIWDIVLSRLDRDITNATGRIRADRVSLDAQVGKHEENEEGGPGDAGDVGRNMEAGPSVIGTWR